MTSSRAGINAVNVDLAERTMNDMFGDPGDWNLQKLRGLTVRGRTKYPLMRDDEVPLQNMPFSAWAPPPFDRINHSIMDQLITGFNSTNTVVPFPARLQTLKARLWNGMVPMTGVRWKEKRLDDPKNFQQFFDLMCETIMIFAFLNEPGVLERMQHGFNWLAREYEDYGAAINARREQKGIRERLDITSMWAEYMEALLTTMATRTHQWLVERVDEIQKKSKTEYEAAVAAVGNDLAAVTSAGKAFFERIQDINLALSRADFVLFIPMDGFSGHDISTGVRDLSLAVRQDLYYKLSDARLWERHMPFVEQTDRETGLRDPKAVTAWFHESRDNRAAIRNDLRGTPKRLGEAHWITILRSRIDWYLKHGGDPTRQTWGFVCYRLTYRQTDLEWARFKEKLEADLMKSGEWTNGAESVKATGGLQWLDGREIGIAEGDIAAAKRHFATFPNTRDFMRRMWKQDFLAVDMQSYLSYSHPEDGQRPEREEGKPYGDMGGHVRLVDTAVYDIQLIKETSPGFKGDFKVLTTLIFDEVYPLLASLAQRPRDLWPLARLHPHSTYVGPTVRCQEEEWEMQRSLKEMMMGSFYNYIRNRQADDGGFPGM
ncbi:hypothetical protein BDV96DRAFT_509681 [Lophiotrema nucula]|uniref:Uncharacterized protein n=1 Tax=Lophiotrema nucula TaxID=690887 RepID=A0A6A5YDX0_9PLEO|nr:hypothetical protein BDV96DRAFT_509681 [Lophiotrema nucula]